MSEYDVALIEAILFVIASYFADLCDDKAGFIILRISSFIYFSIAMYQGIVNHVF